MEEWKEYKISEVIDEISMGPFGSNIKVDNFIDSGVPVLNGSNLQGFKLNEDSFNYVSQEKADSLGKANAHRGDVVITHRGTLGQIVYIPEDSKFEQYVISQSQFRLKLKEDIIKPDFFVYFFHTRLGQHRILMNASQVGVPALARPTSTFKEVSVPVPAMEVQKRVMDILHSLDDKIAIIKRINDNLEQQGQALFEEFVMNPNKPRTQLLSDYALINPTRTIAKGRAARCIDMSSLPTKGTFPSDWTFKKYNGGMKFQNGDTIMARITPCLENGKTAYINFLDENEVAFGSTEYIVLSAHEGFCSELLYFLARYDDFVSYAVSHMNGSSGRQRVSGNDIANYVMPEISNETMDVVSEKLHGIMEVIKNNSLESRRLAEIRDALLPRLMSGDFKLEEVNM